MGDDGQQEINLEAGDAAIQDLADVLPGDEVPEDGDEQLDVETQQLLDELARSQAEVQQMLALQREQATELGGMKNQLTAELNELQDEAWKLQVYGELEVLKRQLAAVNALEADLDAAEAVLDATEGDDPLAGVGSTRPSARRNKARTTAAAGQEADAAGADEDGADEENADEDDDAAFDEDREYDEAEITAMQAQLDSELAEMFAQLQAVKSEAAAVSARKAALEAELSALMAAHEMEFAQQSAGDMQQLADDDEDAAGGDADGADAAGPRALAPEELPIAAEAAAVEQAVADLRIDEAASA